jgi:hypothetical protein
MDRENIRNKNTAAGIEREISQSRDTSRRDKKRGVRAISGFTGRRRRKSQARQSRP